MYFPINCKFIKLLFFLGFLFQTTVVTSIKCDKILFIGNSLTYRNDMPGMFSKSAKNIGHCVDVELSVKGGKDLKYHSENSNTRKMLEKHNWDYVVLQERSTSTITNVTVNYADQLVKLSQNSTFILYQTWAHKYGVSKSDSYEKMQIRVNNGYEKLKKDLVEKNPNTKIVIAPVGRVWSKLYGVINMYKLDQIHPKRSGSFLASTTILTTIYGRKEVINLKWRPTFVCKRVARKILTSVIVDSHRGKRGNNW